MATFSSSAELCACCEVEDVLDFRFGDDDEEDMRRLRTAVRRGETGSSKPDFSLASRVEHPEEVDGVRRNGRGRVLRLVHSNIASQRL